MKYFTPELCQLSIWIFFSTELSSFFSFRDNSSYIYSIPWVRWGSVGAGRGPRLLVHDKMIRDILIRYLPSSSPKPKPSSQQHVLPPVGINYKAAKRTKGRFSQLQWNGYDRQTLSRREPKSCSTSYKRPLWLSTSLMPTPTWDDNDCKSWKN